MTPALAIAVDIGDPSSIRRNERPAIACPLFALTSALNHLHANLIERMTEDFLPALDHRGDEQLSPVGAETHDRRKARHHAPVELDAESNEAIRRRVCRWGRR